MLLSDYFYRYLFSQPDAVPSQIKDYGEALSLQSLDSPDINRITALLENRPEPYTPGTHDQDTDIWLEGHRIYGLWYPDEKVKEALRLLEDPKNRNYIEGLILSPIRLETFAKELPHEYSVAGVKLYKHYFFNVDLIPASELPNVISTNYKHSMIADVYPDEDIAMTILNHFYNEKPSNFTAGKIAKLMIGTTGAKLLSKARGEFSATDALASVRYMNVLEKAQDILAGGGIAVEDFVDLLNKVAIEKFEPPMPTYIELTTGNTEQLPPKKEVFEAEIEGEDEYASTIRNGETD